MSSSFFHRVVHSFEFADIICCVLAVTGNFIAIGENYGSHELYPILLEMDEMQRQIDEHRARRRVLNVGEESKEECILMKRKASKQKRMHDTLTGFFETVIAFLLDRFDVIFVSTTSCTQNHMSI